MIIDADGLEDSPRCFPHTYAEKASGGEFIPYPHLEYVGDRITEHVHRGNGRLIINMPPGHGKSELISHWTPTWFLDEWPGRRVMMATHTDKLSRRWGRAVRNEFRANPYTTTKLSPDSEASDQWNTPEGGGMKSAGIGAALSGFHFNLGIVDDAINSWAQAYSHAYRQGVQDWFDSVFYQRRLLNATIIVLMTRWHEHDLVGYLTREHPDDWEVIRFPGLAEDDDPLGREPGEPLCPQLKTEDDLKADAGNKAVFRALIQQDPQGLGDSRVYSSYSHERNRDEEIKLVNDLPLQAYFDFNVNPGMHIEIGQYDPTGRAWNWGRDLFIVRHEIHGPRMDVRQAMVELIELLNEIGPWRWPLLEIYGDQTGTTGTVTTSESCYDIIEQYLIRERIPYEVILPSRNPPQLERIDAVNEALYDIDNHVHAIIHPDCERLLADMTELPKGEDGLIDKSKQKLSHPSDAWGYGVWMQRPILIDNGSSSSGGYAVD